MKKTIPLTAIALALLQQSACASASDFFKDSTVDLKWKVNYYDISGDKGHGTIPVSKAELVGLAPQLAPAAGMLPSTVDVDINNDMSIKDFGTSAWVNWRSGWLFDHIGVELEYQGAGIFDQSGTVTTTASAALPPPIGAQRLSMTNPNPYYYRTDPDESTIGKVGNANLRLKFGEDDAQTQLIVGQFTPTIYDLLHRPDEIYYGMHQVYRGASIQGNYEWSWGNIQPWFNYFTGYSNEYNESFVDFKDDLNDNFKTRNISSYLNGGYDEIYNIGFHTETDYYVSSASLSYAEDYLANGIIEVYTGIPYSYLGLGSASEDHNHRIKFLFKYGFEEGKGKNSDHSTDVWEMGVGVDHGNFDILTGITWMGDEQFAGFETQDGMKAGGGTAVWGDVAILNKFNRAGQRVYYVVGGYNLDGWNLPNWRVQGVMASAHDTDLSKLNLMDRIGTPKADYKEYNLDIIYAKNGYQGDGMSYLLKLGKDTNFEGFGFGFFVEYNGDLTKFMHK